MAIDMLESTEIGTFSDSRLGNKCFIDDSEYNNLFGSKKRKKADAQASSTIYARYEIPAGKRNDCEWLNNKLIEANNHYQAVLSKNLKQRLTNRETRPLADVVANLKTALQQSKCDEKEAVREQEKAQEKAIEEINKAASTPIMPEDGSSGDTGDTGGQSKTTKFLIYGIGGLAVVVLAVALLRKRG